MDLIDGTLITLAPFCNNGFPVSLLAVGPPILTVFLTISGSTLQAAQLCKAVFESTCPTTKMELSSRIS